MRRSLKRTPPPIRKWKRLGLLVALTCVAALTAAASAAAAPTVSYLCTPVPSSCVGWYTSNVSIQWTYSDPDGVMNTDGCNVHTLTTDTGGSPEHCYVQNVHGVWTKIDLSLMRDGTPPTVNPGSPARGPDANGWYSGPVAIDWSGTDATSGFAGCPTVTYSGPDSPSASAAGGTCHDQAGNAAAAPAFSLKYDATDPQIASLAAARVPDANGWYNHAVGLTWSDSDAMSGIAGCSSAPYSGPDSATASLAVTCTDKAGNSASGTLGLKYDETDPQITNVAAARVPDANGWYNHAVSLSWSDSDATSGIAGCSSPPYSGPDSATASLAVTCTDKAANSASAAISLKYDDTAPAISVTPDRAPNANGWYTSKVDLTWTKSDTVSGVDAAACSLPTDYSGPESANASVTGHCSDNAGNQASKAFALKYDSQPPVVNAGTPARAPDSNAWYSHPVAVTWSGTDATSGMAGCTSATYSGPDSATASVPGGTCQDQAGNGAVGQAFGLKYDATPPHITGATLSRPPDFNGWYTHPVTITWTGADALSGIASCTSAPYSGQAGAQAVALGSCRDRAGNVASASIPLNYDGTAPTLSKVTVASRAASDLVRWLSTSPGDQIVVKRSVRGSNDEQVVFEGTGSRFVDTKIEPGIEYRYAIESTDQAGNVSKTATVAGLPKILTLRKMPYIPRAAPKPILEWKTMKGASYYHVQLFRGSRRILAAWPSKRQLGLANAWRWAGRRYTLSPGRYRWFVWGGLGKRSFARYHAIGSARFIVPSR